MERENANELDWQGLEKDSWRREEDRAQDRKSRVRETGDAGKEGRAEVGRVHPRSVVVFALILSFASPLDGYERIAFKSDSTKKEDEMDPVSLMIIFFGGAVLASRAKREKEKERGYDEVFKEYGRGIPVAYLRALGMKESGLRAGLKDTSAWGLLQVVEVVRKDYNENHGTSWTREDLLTAEVNVAIASDVLKRIIRGYKKYHPKAINMVEDWSNPRFVELLTFGWNAGMSEKAGVGKVAKYLEGMGEYEFDIGDVVENAEEAGAAKTIGNEKKMRWSVGVAKQFVKERKKGNV